MEQPATPNTLPSPPSPPTTEKNTAATTASIDANNTRRPPTPEEVLAHYEEQGLESKEASLRAIGDLQALLFRAVASGRVKKDRFMGDSSRKLDNISTRLAILDMKLDAKPGYPESIAIGVTSGAVLGGMGAAWPHVVGAIGGIWDAVRSATKSSMPPSS